MSEEIDKHVLRKYEIQQKLGKGVRNFVGLYSLAQARCSWIPGIRNSLEICGQEDPWCCSLEKNLWRVPKRNRCTANVSRNYVSARGQQPREYSQVCADSLSFAIPLFPSARIPIFAGCWMSWKQKMIETSIWFLSTWKLTCMQVVNSCVIQDRLWLLRCSNTRKYFGGHP